MTAALVTATTRFFDATARRFCECAARDEDEDDDDDDEEEEEELGRIASLCERLEMHLVADEKEAVALTRRVVETIEKEAAAFLSSSALKVKGGDKRERRAKAAKRVLTQHHAERLLQKMLVKMLKIGEEEMAGKIGDGIEQLYRLGKERKEVRTFRMEKKSMVADATASAAEDDEYSDADAADDERTVELRAVACSQVGADATKRNPEVQLFRMQFNKGVEVRVHESSWSDAGLAWRIWGSAKVAFKVVDRSAYFRDKNKTYLELRKWVWFNRCGYCELRWTVYGYGRCAGRFDSFTQNCRGRQRCRENGGHEGCLSGLERRFSHARGREERYR